MPTFWVNSVADVGDTNPGDGSAWTGVNLPDGTPEVTLRSAIQEANALGVQIDPHEIGFMPLVTLGPATILLSRPMDDIRVPTIIDGSNKGLLTITRDPGAGNFHFFTVATTPGLPTDFTVRFNNLTITGGRGSMLNNAAGNTGGAIHNAANLVLNDVDVRDSRAYHGGAIYNATTGVLTLTNCVLANNQATDGGAIYTTGNGRITISDSILSGNSAVTKGGAIHMNVQSRVTLFNTNLSNNTANDGGAVYSSVGRTDVIPFQMTGGRAWNNTATTVGGALSLSTSNARLDGVQLDNNSAHRGGAIYSKNNSLDLLSCTFIDNAATLLGPHVAYVGVLDQSVWITLTNCNILTDDLVSDPN